MLVVVGAAMDTYSLITADKPFRRGLQIVSAWSGAAVLAARIGRFGAAIGTAIEPGGGTAIGGIAGAIVGGFIGYLSANGAAGYVYDWAENTIFTTMPEVPLPKSFQAPE